MNDLLIIKFGGSVISYKDSQNPKARVKTIQKLSRELAKIYSAKEYRIIIVHGAGSFGHPIVKKYSLHEGMENQIQLKAYSETTNALMLLNNLVVKSLIENDIPAVSLPPHSFIKQNQKDLAKIDLSLINKLLINNQVPVLYGDLVLDDKLNCSVLSGDKIISYLSQKLKPKRVIFVSDVNGIYTADPKKDPTAKQIKKINDKNVQQILHSIEQNNSSDVTGEMKGKLNEIATYLPGIKVSIVSGFVKQPILRAIEKVDSTGTMALLRQRLTQ